MPPTVPCPGCASDLHPGVPACPGCHLPLVGPYAHRLYAVETTLRQLVAERAWLVGLLRAGQTGLTVSPPQTTSAWTGQQVLLGLGALLVTLAAAVFVAVAWTVLGVGGQVAIMGAVTVLAGVGARISSRRGLAQTAEALALLTGALTVVDVVAARTLGLIPETLLPTSAYVAAASVVVAAGMAAAAVVTPKVHVYPAAAVLAAHVPALALAVGADVSLPAFLAVALVQGVVGVALASRRGIAVGAMRVAFDTTMACAGVTAALVGATALGLVAVAGNDAGASTGVALALAAAVLWARRLDDTWSTMAWVGAGYAGVILALAVRALAGGETGRAGLVVIATAAALAFAAASRTSVPVPPTTRSEVAVGSLAVLATALLTSDASQAALILGAVAAAAIGRLVLDASDPRTWGVAGAAASASLVCTLVSLDVAVATAAAMVAGASAVLAALAALNRRDERAEIVLGAEAVLAAVASLALVADGSPARQAGVTFALGGVALLYALLPRRGSTAVAGLLLCATGSWALLADAGIEQIEAYTLPLAAGLGLIGLVHSRRHPEASSWVTAGPAVLLALGPSTAVATAEGTTAYLAAVLAAATGTAVAAVWARQQAALTIASGAALALALVLAGPSVAALPRWLTLGAAGAALLAAGASYEAGLARLRSAGRWVEALR